jgi:hypothetical protein
MSTQHLSADTLADLQEGLLDRSAADEAAAHLHGCAQCRTDRRALDGVRSRLAEEPGPPDLPPEVARRLDDALAAAPGPEAHRPPVAAPTVTPLRRTGPGRVPVGNRVLQAAAAAVLVLGAAAVGIGALTGGGDEAATSADSAAGGQAGVASGPEATTGTFRVLTTGTDYGPDAVAGAVPGLLTSRQGTEVSMSDPADLGTAEDADGREAAPVVPARSVLPIADLTGCLGELAQGGPDTPLAADVASFRGQDAVLLVLPTQDDPAAVDVWVVTPQCSADDATLLHFARTARP